MLNGNNVYGCTSAGGESITAYIRKFMKFTLDNTGKKLWKKFNTVWRKDLMMMTSAPGNEGVSDFVINEGGQITEANLQ